MAKPQINEVRRLVRLGLPLVLTFASDWGLVTTATVTSSWNLGVRGGGCRTYLYTGDVDGRIFFLDTLRADGNHCRSLGLW